MCFKYFFFEKNFIGSGKVYCIMRTRFLRSQGLAIDQEGGVARDWEFQNTRRVAAPRVRLQDDGQLPVRSGLVHVRGLHPAAVHVAGVVVQAHIPRVVTVCCGIRPPQRRLQEPLHGAPKTVSVLSHLLCSLPTAILDPDNMSRPWIVL